MFKGYCEADIFAHDGHLLGTLNYHYNGHNEFDGTLKAHDKDILTLAGEQPVELKESSPSLNKVCKTMLEKMHLERSVSVQHFAKLLFALSEKCAIETSFCRDDHGDWL
jgi:hypothetical protein